MRASGAKFIRSTDGSVRIRLRFSAEEADAIEAAAAKTGDDVVPWIFKTVRKASTRKGGK